MSGQSKCLCACPYLFEDVMSLLLSMWCSLIGSTIPQDESCDALVKQQVMMCCVCM